MMQLREGENDVLQFKSTAFNPEAKARVDDKIAAKVRKRDLYSPPPSSSLKQDVSRRPQAYSIDQGIKSIRPTQPSEVIPK
jgi:hypothetical protein